MLIVSEGCCCFAEIKLLLTQYEVVLTAGCWLRVNLVDVHL